MSTNDVYKTARGGSLVLKGGKALGVAGGGVKKPSGAGAGYKAKAGDGGGGSAAPGGGGAAPAAGGIGGAVGGATDKTYEELFASEMARAKQAKGRTSAWGTNFREAPAVLHGHSERLDLSKPLTAEQRLDLRAAQKADKFCR